MAWLDRGDVECLCGGEAAQRQGRGGDQVGAARQLLDRISAK
ncbi:hypothetical protein ACFYSF_34225 [Streptomyces canus]